MIKVKVTQKFHSNDGKLIGYRIMDESGKQMDVYKDQLKMAVANKQVECVNMTLTSDGRLIGKASNKPMTPQKQKSGVILCDLFTNGKNIIGAIINDSEHRQINNMKPFLAKGVKPGTAFEVGNEALSKANCGWYDNIVKTQDNKIDFKASQVRKITFSKVRDKLIGIIKENIGQMPIIEVEKVGKEDYGIHITNYDIFGNDIIQIIYIIIVDALIKAEIKPDCIDEDTVSCRTSKGISEVRKAIKTIK